MTGAVPRRGKTRPMVLGLLCDGNKYPSGEVKPLVGVARDSDTCASVRRPEPACRSIAPALLCLCSH